MKYLNVIMDSPDASKNIAKFLDIPAFPLRSSMYRQRRSLRGAGAPAAAAPAAAASPLAVSAFPPQVLPAVPQPAISAGIEAVAEDRSQRTLSIAEKEPNEQTKLQGKLEDAPSAEPELRTLVGSVSVSGVDEGEGLIILLGLPKSGTASVRVALEKLEIKTAHFQVQYFILFFSQQYSCYFCQCTNYLPVCH